MIRSMRRCRRLANVALILSAVMLVSFVLLKAL